MIFVTHYLRLQLSKLSRQNIVTVMHSLGCFGFTTQVQSSVVQGSGLEKMNIPARHRELRRDGQEVRRLLRNKSISTILSV